ILSNSPELALADFEEAIRLKGAEANTLLGRATARVRLGKPLDAAQDAEAGVRLAGGDIRLLYKAARVFALAVPEKRIPSLPGKLTPEGAFHATCEARAAELLRRVLEATPPADLGAFWKEYVERDRAFDAVRNGRPMARLASEFGKT